jgi:hypothetical protein
VQPQQASGARRRLEVGDDESVGTKEALARVSTRKAGGLAQLVRLAVGVRVMLRRNQMDISAMQVNGAQGVVVAIEMDSPGNEVVHVRFDHDINVVQPITRVSSKFNVDAEHFSRR